MFRRTEGEKTKNYMTFSLLSMAGKIPVGLPVGKDRRVRKGVLDLGRMRGSYFQCDTIKRKSLN